MIPAIKRAAAFIFWRWPWGYVCDFIWEGQSRIRVTKNLWVIIGGWGSGDSTDALPLSFCSKALVDRVTDDIKRRWWYLPPHGDRAATSDAKAMAAAQQDAQGEQQCLE